MRDIGIELHRGYELVRVHLWKDNSGVLQASFCTSADIEEGKRHGEEDFWVYSNTVVAESPDDLSPFNEELRLREFVKEETKKKVSPVRVTNIELWNGSYREYIIGYDFVNGRYIVQSDVIDYYTLDELKTVFNLEENDLKEIEKTFDN